MKPIRILVAPDSMKECLEASEVAAAIRRGLVKRLPEAVIVACPLSDGGEGMVRILASAVSAATIRLDVSDPLHRPVEAVYALDEKNKTAYIEIAAASGMQRVTPAERNPAVTCTFGTGELIRDALRKGATTILLGLGGSATNDAGMGLLRALGIQLYDKDHIPLAYGGLALMRLADIDVSGCMEECARATFILACDVSNPLTGTNGASYVYGPQKGADEQMIQVLDQALSHAARVVQATTGKDLEQVAGTGAAGGTALALLGFLHAELTRGFDLVARLTDLETHIQQADIVITAEGKLDAQSLNGKVPVGVAQLCRKYHKPCLVLAGSIQPGAEKIVEYGAVYVSAIQNGPMTAEASMAQAASLLEQKAFHLAGMFPLWLDNKNV